MIRVCVAAPTHLSRAMHRVSAALVRHAPSEVIIVPAARYADVEVLHVIGEDAVGYESPAKQVAVIQYCTNKVPMHTWHPLWSRATCVWSYYDLGSFMPPGATFYYAPLGIDDAFLTMPYYGMRREHVFTSGYVAGQGAEAIEEFARAADASGLATIHLGPLPVGLTQKLPVSWTNFHDISDDELACLYNRSRWVSGLRYIEGFEMPVIEGLAQGARPIVFDRPDMRQWYDGHAVFVPECGGKELIGLLMKVFHRHQEPVSLLERQEVLQKFCWKTIVEGFWSTVLQRQDNLHPAVGLR